MEINKLTASFGKLENESLTLHDGLNLIYAPNESGKSTWCAFIRAMLYGVDSSQRAKAGYLPDKTRYAPWSGTPMEGTMDLTADRCDITLTRTTKAKNAPMREFSATYTGTATPVDGLNGTNAGEMLTGVTGDVFYRSAFISQDAMAISSTPELEKRIAAIVSSGEEATSYTDADEKLRSWQRTRRFNRYGLLPDLEGQMDAVQRRLADLGSIEHEIEDKELELNQETEKCAQLEQAVTESRKQQRRSALKMLSDGRTELKKSSEEHDEALCALSNARNDLRSSQFGLQSQQAVEEKANADIEEIKALKVGAGTSLVPILAVVFLVLAVACAAVYIRWRQVFVICFAAAFCVVAVVMLLRLSKMRSTRQAAEDRRREILKQYGAGSVADIDSALRHYSLLWDNLRGAEQRELETRRTYEYNRDNQERLEQSAMGELDFAGGTSQAAVLSQALTAERQKAERTSAEISTLKGKLAATGDPMVLSSELKRMEEEYDRLNLEYDSLTLAIETLRFADGQIQSRFSPELGKLAGEYMSLVTGGRYEDVLINRDFTAKTRTAQDAVARDSEYLSKGTLDLLYLAVRLAVCELALPSGEPCPLIIDDALVNLDEERFAQAMELLKEIAKTRQVIFFTCRKS